MPELSIGELDEGLLEALRARAMRNHRSVQSEVKHILEQELARETKPRPPLKLHTVSIQGGPPVYSRDVIDPEPRLRTVNVGGPIITRAHIYGDED
ncbi:MAG: Arc family DNA-binding protein [Myxococcota bacterium]